MAEIFRKEFECVGDAGVPGINRVTLIMWKIEETEEELSKLVTNDDRMSALRFGSEKRRREHLAWRAALRTVVPDRVVGYDKCSAPYIAAEGDNGRIYLSAAHTDGMAVVLISGRPCAVDVEYEERDLSKHASRFISSSALALPAAGDTLFPLAVWCAKETMYKIGCDRELSFIDDIIITYADLEGGKIKGVVKGQQEREISLMRHGGYILTYII